MLVEEYKSCSTHKCKYVGLLFKRDKFKGYLINTVKDRYFDEEGTSDISKYAIETTGFNDKIIVGKIKDILKSQVPLEDWRIGEAVAELILEDRFNIRFYYDSTRDAKNMCSSPSGADLVGFAEIDNDTVFAFGEVKTSSEERYPPNVLYGRTGMIKQLEDLKLSENKRDELIRWISFKSKSLKGKLHSDYKKALIAYLCGDKKRVKLIGVLIRDTRPNIKDLQNRAKTLGENKSDLMEVQLIALYSNYKMENDQWINCLQGGK